MSGNRIGHAITRLISCESFPFAGISMFFLSLISWLTLCSFLDPCRKIPKVRRILLLPKKALLRLTKPNGLHLRTYAQHTMLSVHSSSNRSRGSL